MRLTATAMLLLSPLIMGNTDAPTEIRQSPAVAKRYTKAYYACMDNGGLFRGYAAAFEHPIAT